jgi:hypothetical protein
VCDGTLLQKLTDVAEECTDSILGVREYDKQEAGSKHNDHISTMKMEAVHSSEASVYLLFIYS